MKTTIRILCIAGMLILLLTACTASVPQTGEATPEPAAETTFEPDEPVTVELVTTPRPAAITEAPATDTPVPEPTEAPTDTPEPTPGPDPTREPREGDITSNFPNYDTGEDADYSYQSDEIRIAIRITKDAEKKQTYYVADIWVRSIYSIRTVFAHNKFNSGTEEGDVIAKRENAILAVNGSYNQGLAFHGGKLYKQLRQNKGWNSCAACLIYEDGTMKTFRLGKEKLDIKEEIKNGAIHGWQFGPIIIRDYEIDQQISRYSLGYKARNMLGYYEPGHYVIVTCDAGRKDAEGMNEDQMAELMKSLGVKEAFNLDGGTSSVMVFMGEIINRPTTHNDDGKVVSGRALKDMLLFGEYDANGVGKDLSTLTASRHPGKN